MRQSEIKMRYDPEMGRYVKQQIYGEGIMDLIKSVESKVFGNTAKEMAKKAVKKGLLERRKKPVNWLEIKPVIKSFNY